MASRVAAVGAIPAMIVLVVLPLLVHPWTLGLHDWDQMHTEREIVVKSIARFHQFPLWDPFTCGGHPAWAWLESAPIAVSPWLPAYLLAPLPIAIRIEAVLSAILGAVGCWCLASRFTKSVPLRALLAIGATVNSRWSQQLAAGHSWHLIYGYLPWVLFFFDRAIAPDALPRAARRDILLASVCLALMVYGNGIYPAPHTAILLAVYASLVARSWRSWRPLRALAAVGTLSVGFSAPKLLPVLELLHRFPRHVRSEEAIWPQDIIKILTWRVGAYDAKAPFINGMWHEWGLYLGWLGLGLLVAGVAVSRGPRERALGWASFVMVLFVIGGFHQLTPWRIAHLLPILSSQHVPSRWLYPAMIALGCVAVSGGERWLAQRGKRRAVFEAGLGFVALVLAIDMGLVARMPLAESFVGEMPPYEKEATFHQMHRLWARGGYKPGGYDVASLPGVMENVGTLECVTYGGLHTLLRDEDGRMAGLGAWGADDPEYRGEVYLAEGSGTAEIVSWTPNEVVVKVDGANPGDRVVMNQNWDPGWLADDEPAVAYKDALAAVLHRPDETVRFRYWPRALGWGIGLLAAAVIASAFWLQRGREGPR